MIELYKQQETKSGRIYKLEGFRKLLSVWQHPSLDGLILQDIINMRNDYPGLSDYYLRWKNNIPAGMNASSTQHQAMAQHYKGIIEQALKEFDDSHSDEFYDDLSWGALFVTGTFDHFHPDGSTSRTRIINTNLAEDTNTMTGSINPLGDSCE